MDSSWETGALCKDGESVVEWCHIVLLLTIGSFNNLMSLFNHEKVTLFKLSCFYTYLKWCHWIVSDDGLGMGSAIDSSENSTEHGRFSTVCFHLYYEKLIK